jgi:DNA helicase-2/ATP-dependent DNA helicase PcrA
VVREASLAVSWRNESSILEVANSAAAPLRERSAVHVEPLRSKGQELGMEEPRRVSAGVSGHYFTDLRAEAAGVVDFIQARRGELAGGDAPVTAAVLCRRRAQFGAIVQACEDADLDYEVVGLGGLLDTPEVADVVALLETAHDPSRGDSLMRLLTSERVALGASDLMALRDWSRESAGPRDSREGAPSIVDAMADPPPEDWQSRDARALTPVARTRLAGLQTVVDAIRTHTYLPLTELVLFAERAWGLDIEAAVARPDGRAARNIDAFVDAARTFAAGAEHATVGAFLAWLDAARDEESGLDSPVKEPDPHAVQILTVHAAKGLEWDVVAVPGLNDGQFPKVTPPSTSQPTYRDAAWLQGVGDLPWELRMDRGDLPEWDWREATDHASLMASVETFKARAGDYRLDEERRLFYVAVTRARSHVLLSGAWWSTGTTTKQPSPFLIELAEQSLVDASQWSEPPGDDEDPPEAHGPSATWPPVPTQAQRERREFAAKVTSAVAALAEMPQDSQRQIDPDLPLATEVSAMLAERSERASRVGDVSIPAHLSTSALVSLRRDRDAFIAQLRRPLPGEPTVAAARGSALHAWIERHFGHQSLLTDEDLGPGEDAGPNFDDLKDTFSQSEWAARQPSDIEVDVEVPIGTVTVRSRIDAVFPLGRGLDRVTVVDWKSGRPPTDPEDQAAREVQLAVYRLAWAEWKGLDADQVDAAFYYVATDQTVRPERLLTREQMEELILGTAR